MEWLGRRAARGGSAGGFGVRGFGRRSVRPRSGSQRDDDRARVRFALRRGPGGPVLRRVAAGLRVASGLVVSDRGLLPELQVSRVGLRVEPRPDRALARPGADPLRGQPAVLGVVLGRDASGVRRAGAGCRGCCHEPPERDAGEIELGRRCSRGRATTWRPTSDTGWSGTVRCSPTTFMRGTASCAPGRRRRRVAHCPSSNAFLGSGLFPLRRHLDSGSGSRSAPTSAPAPV